MVLGPAVKPGELTELDRFIFDSWGYLLIEDVLSEAEVEECCGGVAAAARRSATSAGASWVGAMNRSRRWSG